MAMELTEFQQALRAAASEPFASIPPEQEIVFRFSPAFTDKMEQLVEKQQSGLWRLFHTKSKQAWLILCALLLALITTACAVKPIREGVVDFVEQLFSTHSETTFAGDTVDRITRIYTFENLPEGFACKSRQVSDLAVVTAYENPAGEQIQCMQIITDGTQTNDDLEHGTVEIIRRGSQIFRLYQGQGVSKVVWVQDQYLFTIIWQGTPDQKQLLSMAEHASVQR